ncbi:MAG: carboxypeptidase regulatory-like domain-containing protein, partial [Pseudomonadales bacterium]|nr:carboxypeptidase regulatory-like domain-containing protein [Pseudomonadales bacterium]
MKHHLWRTVCITLFASLLALGGCSEFEGDDGAQGPQGPQGPAGAQGDPGVSITTGTISGTVKNSMSSEPVEGVTVSGAGSGATTDADGSYTISDAAAGTHQLSFSKANFNTSTSTIYLNADETVTKNVSLSPVAAVVVSVDDVTVDAYGGNVTLTASVECFDGRSSCGTTWNWSHSGGAAPARITTYATTATVTLGSLA